MNRILLFLLYFYGYLFTNSADATVSSAMSIDLGVEFIKMALIKPGVPMEIVLNQESHRKTPFALTIKQQERFFGDEALKKSISAPRHTFTFFLDLIGKTFDDPVVAQYQKQFPYLQLKPNDQRKTVNFVTEAGELPIETMLAMVLAHAGNEVAAYAGQPVKDVVIAVPAHFGQSERKAVETAAKIAGLNPIQLMSAGASAGLNYGVFRYKEITEEPQTYLIYDVGSTKVQATILRYQTFNDTESSAGGSIPKLEVAGYGFDSQLGGHHLTLKLRDLLVEEFSKSNPKTTADITTSPQAMAKLLKEAGRVKHVLSANTETFAQVESVFQDIDFKTKVSRQQLEEMFKEFEERMMAPINQGMEMAKFDDKEKLDKILLMGAGTRVPRLQELLGQFFAGKQLGRNLNTDEAIALGAVYQAARYSKNFRVKRFDVVDAEPPQPSDEMTPMSQEEIDQAKKILNDFDKLDKARVEREKALHSLESAVFDYTYKLEEDDFKQFGTSDELESISKALAQLREWLEDVPAEIAASQLKEMRRELMKPIRKLKNRQQQKEERPEQIKYLEKHLTDANKQLGVFRNTTDIFTPDELDTYEKSYNNTYEWYKGKKIELESLADNQDATFTADDLKSKANMLNSETKILLRKMIMAFMKKEEAEKAAKERSVQMKHLEENLEDASKQLSIFRNTTDIFTPDELDTYEKSYNNTYEWYKGKKIELESLADNQDATFTADDLKSKANVLKFDTKNMLKKYDNAVPLKKDEAKKEETAPVDNGGESNVEEKENVTEKEVPKNETSEMKEEL